MLQKQANKWDHIKFRNFYTARHSQLSNSQPAEKTFANYISYNRYIHSTYVHGYVHTNYKELKNKQKSYQIKGKQELC
jgi:hypothetical protein